MTIEEKKKKKSDRCIRIAKRKYDTWPSAYASGAVVKCRQGKIWKGIKEAEEDNPEEPNVLDLSKELDSGFCEFNPLINKFAQYSPDNLAEMLIFVIATQQQRWYDVVPKFPLLMAYVKKNDTLLDPEKASTNEKGELIYELPKSFSQLTLGFRKDAIQWVWDNKDSIYSAMKPLFNQFNNSGEDSIAKEEAMFKIYLELIKVKGLGLPKAAFASQLIIGRLGCIDSINLNLYKGLDKEGELITYDKKKGTPNFKTPGTSIDKKTGIMQVSKGGIKLAEKYVQFLKHIAELTKSSEAQISQKLWDSWCELVALKINKTGDIKVKMPGGEEFTVPNDYSKNVSGAETNPAAKFRKDYIGKISAKDISRQHHPEKMFEGYKKWSKYIKNLIVEQYLDEMIDEEIKNFFEEEQIEEKKKPDFEKEKESGLHGWFSRQGGKGKSKGWVDCNTCRKDEKTGKKTCKTCGREEGEKRSKYPACRPKPSDCGSSGKGEDWGKKSAKKEALQIENDLLKSIIEEIIKDL